MRYADPAGLKNQQQQPQTQYRSVPIDTPSPKSPAANPGAPAGGPAKPPQKIARAAAPRADFDYTGFSSLSAGCVIEVHNSPQYEKLITNRAKIVVLCITTDTPICNTASKLFRQYAIENSHADFLLVDYNEMKEKIPEIAKFTKLPHFRFYKEGKMVKEFGGQFQDDYLKSAITNIVLKAKPKEESADVITSEFHVPGKVVVLTKEEVLKKILSIPDVLIILNYYDNEKISQEMIPSYNKFADQFQNAIFCSIDVIACKNSIRSCYGATRLPSFRFFKNGEKLKEWQGKDPEYLLSLIKQWLKVK
jgi:hypothetical protein